MKFLVGRLEEAWLERLRKAAPEVELVVAEDGEDAVRKVVDCTDGKVVSFGKKDKPSPRGGRRSLRGIVDSFWTQLVTVICLICHTRNDSILLSEFRKII